MGIPAQTRHVSQCLFSYDQMCCRTWKAVPPTASFFRGADGIAPAIHPQLDGLSAKGALRSDHPTMHRTLCVAVRAAIEDPLDNDQLVCRGQRQFICVGLVLHPFGRSSSPGSRKPAKHHPGCRVAKDVPNSAARTSIGDGFKRSGDRMGCAIAIVSSVSNICRQCPEFQRAQSRVRVTSIGR